MFKSSIPYQNNEAAFLIRKIMENFDAKSIAEYPHRHGFHELLYIKSGVGQHEVDGVTYDLKANTFYLISKGQAHNFLLAKDINGLLIRFQESILPSVISSTEGFYHNLLYRLNQHNSINLIPSDRLLVELLLERMLSDYENQSNKILDLSLILHLLYPLLILLNRYESNQLNSQDYKEDQFTQFLNLLEKSFKNQHDLGFYANQLGLSKRQLSAICQQKRGKSAKYLIMERLLTEAKRFMKYTSLPLKEIASQLGFKDIGYFCRFFKNGVGLTPSEYKGVKVNE